MGYCISISESDFIIDEGKEELILDALRKFALSEERIDWVNKNFLINARTIYEAFDEIRYPLVYDKNTKTYSIDYFSGEKLGDDFKIFNAIAPYVKEGSFIEITGEDTEFWRWIFKDGKCHEVYSEITWPEV